MVTTQSSRSKSNDNVTRVVWFYQMITSLELASKYVANIGGEGHGS